MARYDLSDEEWTIIEPLLPRRGKGKRRVDDRRVVNGIFYVLRTGAPWRDLPERYGPWQTVWRNFNEWRQAGVLEDVKAALLGLLNDADQLN